MAQTAANTPSRTPLDRVHRSLGARMVSFAGWEMPVEYAGISKEHMAVRTSAGLFDVSHMGEIEVTGTDALAAIQYITSNDPSRLQVGQAQYSALMTPRGTFVDDLLVYRFACDHFLMVVNASNVDKDFQWIADHVRGFGHADTVNSSSRYALLALQGPVALEVLQRLTDIELRTIKYYWFVGGEVAGVTATISRTGYTGEDGFELFVPPDAAETVWNEILRSGSDAGVMPAGLGARDTLRLEAAMRLYGNDIDDTTTVLEADLAWIIDWKKGDFIGRDVLQMQKQSGLSRRLAGFEMIDRAIARHGADVYIDGVKAGTVTSGTQTPFLKKAIGMAYLPADRTEPGQKIDVEIRGRRGCARVVTMPFYKRPRS